MFSRFRKKKPPIVQATPTFEIVGYWNGICPFCKTHIGIDIMQCRETGEKTASCPVCNSRVDTEKA